MALGVKNPPANAGNVRDSGSFHPWVRKIPWRRARQPPPVFMPGESHGQRHLADNSPWGHKESDTTEVTKPTLYTKCLEQSLAFYLLWFYHYYYILKYFFIGLCRGIVATDRLL